MSDLFDLGVEVDGASRREFERATAEAVERLPVPFFVLGACDGAEGRFQAVWANDSARQLAGDDAVWPDVDHLLGHCPGLGDEVTRVHTEGQVSSGVWPVDRHGRIDHLRLVLLPLEGGVALFAQDVSREAAVRDDLDVVERTLERVQQWGQMGVWEVDLRTGEQYWSSQVFAILDVDEATVECFRAAVHPDDLDLVDHVLGRAVDQPGPYKFNHRVVRSEDIRSVSQHLQSVPGADGRPERLIGAVIDVTATQALEQQLHRNQRVRSIGLLAGGLAHDFKNALAVLLGHIDVMERNEAVMASADLTASLGAMKRATTKATALTRKLMSLGQHGEPDTEVLAATAVLREAARLLGPVLGSEIQLSVVTDDDAEAEAEVSVEADPAHVEQVLVDVILNARDAGASSIQLSARRVDVGAGDELELAWGLTPGAYGVLSVTDDGSGMDDQTLRQIFEPFFTTKSSEEGSGLGLANADRFAHHAGGAIVATSRPGEGTTMSLHLPLVDRPTVAAGPARSRPRPTRAVVSVDDTDRARRLQELLESRGHQVAVARSAAETSWMTVTEPIDLVVIDASRIDVAAERTLDPDRTIVLGGSGSGPLAEAASVDELDDTAAVGDLVDLLLPR